MGILLLVESGLLCGTDADTDADRSNFYLTWPQNLPQKVRDLTMSYKHNTFPITSLASNMDIEPKTK